MKKTMLSIVAILCMAPTMPLWADSEPISLQEEVINPTSPLVPSVSLDDHTLYFFTPCDGYTLNLVDENDVVVYTIVIPTGTTSWVLPSTLSGEYELQLISGNYCFWGMITL